MRFSKIIIIAILALAFVACSGDAKPTSPLDTLKKYHLAIKKKDTTTMKLLISEESLRIHQKEAQEQGLTLDDIVLRDTLFPAEQRVFKKRNETIEGDKASIEVENSMGSYDTIYLVLEDGIWKIDKKTTSDQMIRQVVDPSDDFEEQLKKKRQEIEDTMDEPDSPVPSVSPSNSPSPTDSTDSTEMPNSTETNPPPAFPSLPTVSPTP